MKFNFNVKPRYKIYLITIFLVIFDLAVGNLFFFGTSKTILGSVAAVVGCVTIGIISGQINFYFFRKYHPDIYSERHYILVQSDLLSIIKRRQEIEFHSRYCSFSTKEIFDQLIESADILIKKYQDRLSKYDQFFDKKQSLRK